MKARKKKRSTSPFVCTKERTDYIYTYIQESFLIFIEKKTFATISAIGAKNMRRSFFKKVQRGGFRLKKGPSLPIEGGTLMRFVFKR